jgi:hypothetical protein
MIPAAVLAGGLPAFQNRQVAAEVWRRPLFAVGDKRLRRPQPKGRRIGGGDWELSHRLAASFHSPDDVANGEGTVPRAVQHPSLPGRRATRGGPDWRGQLSSVRSGHWRRGRPPSSETEPIEEVHVLVLVVALDHGRRRRSAAHERREAWRTVVPDSRDGCQAPASGSCGPRTEEPRAAGGGPASPRRRARGIASGWPFMARLV